MKLALKFTVVFLLGLCPLLAWYSYTVFHREIQLFQNDMRRDNRTMGETLAIAVSQVWRLSGEAAALDWIEKTNRKESHVQIHWVTLENPASRAHRPRAPLDQLSPLVQGQATVVTSRQSDGEDYLYTYVPVIVNGERKGALEVGESLDEQYRYTKSTLARIAQITTLIAVVSGVLMLWLGLKFVGRPIRNLVAATQRVAAGDFTGRIHVRQKDELRELAVAFNRMCDQLSEAHQAVAAETAARIAATEQLRHSDKLRTVGQLTSGVAHELGTPLNVVWARAKMIADDEIPPQEVKDCARVIAEQSARITSIIRRLLDFSRPTRPQKAQVDLYQVVRRTLEMLTPMAVKSGVTMKLIDDSTPAGAEADAEQIQQVISNLVLNGIQSMPKGGSLTLGIRSERKQAPPPIDGTEADYYCLFVQDEGVGIAEDDLHKVFEPFFTTKDVGVGTGLGLSVSFGIVQEHKGWIDVTSEIGRGSCFHVYLPKGGDSCAAAC